MRPSSLVFACVLGLASTGAAVGVTTDAAVGVTAHASATSSHSIAKYVGERGPLATKTKTLSGASPKAGEVDSDEIKSPEVEARENSPQGGSRVLNGKVRPPSSGRCPSPQNATA